MTAISIHATHTGGDEELEKQASQYVISIHATHTGGDSIGAPAYRRLDPFQSTPPIRVATLHERNHRTRSAISIHATHTGGDMAAGSVRCRPADFNPRHPYGWRPAPWIFP